MSSPRLLGFILVAKSHLGGDLMCFRFPPISRQDPTIPNENESGAPNQRRAKERNPLAATENALPTKDTEPPIPTPRSTYEPYHLEADVLAPLLCPKPSLCNAPFTLVLENTLFLGHPCTFKPLPTPTPESSGSHKDSSALRQSALTMFNFVLVIPRSASNSLIKMCKDVVRQVRFDSPVQ
jgi:hypothetical protein